MQKLTRALDPLGSECRDPSGLNLVIMWSLSREIIVSASLRVGSPFNLSDSAFSVSKFRSPYFGVFIIFQLGKLH